MKTYKDKISKLDENQVFVFGSNLDGFHGGGSAGFASFGSGLSFRDLDYFNKPNGWKGKWNVKGDGIGFQQGTEGRSYALPTVVHAGARRSLSMNEIRGYIKDFYNFCLFHGDLEFLVAYGVENMNLNGYSSFEMAEMFATCGIDIPSNVVFQEDFYQLILEILGKNI